MEWNDREICGAGHVVEILSVSWRGASLAALKSGPLSPPEILEVFKAAQAANVSVFGPHAVYMECVKRHLAVLTRGALVEVGPLTGGRRQYLLAPVARAMLDALEPTADYGVLHFDWLVGIGRASRKIVTAESARNFDPPIEGLSQLERLRRRSLALIFSRLFAPRWTYSTLAMLAAGPMRFSSFIDRVERLLKTVDQPHLESHPSRATLTSRLEYLRGIGLVDQIDDTAHRNPARPPKSREVAYVATASGLELLAALESVAKFGVENNDILFRAVRALTP
jgi:DNA-binding HxlR family transcriptional regulator